MTGLADVRNVHRFDIAALDRYLTERVAGFRGPTAVHQFQGGQSNPTYLLETPGRKYVLRRKPPGKLLPSAHAVEREYQVIAALAGTGVPVPRTYLLCEDPAVIGTSFYVMDYVEGRVFRNAALPDLKPAQRAAIYDSMNDVLARLHQVDWAAVGLGGYGKPGNYFARQIHRWTSQYRASETERIESMERLIAWLPAHIPPGDETSLIHGDYRLGNLLIHPTAPRVVAVLDWELSTLGHPLGDLAYNCLAWHLPADLDGLAGEDAPRPGIASEATYVGEYCRRTGRAEIPHWQFYIAFAAFRFAAIWQGIVGRVLAGTANDPNALQHGDRARTLADVAWAIVPPGS